jgi:Zn finger protein HypA/HybF involved in hydrogenase expression
MPTMSRQEQAIWRWDEDDARYVTTRTSYMTMRRRWCPLCHGKNKLHDDEMKMMPTLSRQEQATWRWDEDDAHFVTARTSYMTMRRRWCPLCHGNNKLHDDEMKMMPTLSQQEQATWQWDEDDAHFVTARTSYMTMRRRWCPLCHGKNLIVM